MQVHDICERIAVGEDLKSILESSEPRTVELTISDPDNQIIPLLELIQSYSKSGHSFNIVVDPDDKERAQEFWIDGDGAAKLHINNINKSE